MSAVIQLKRSKTAGNVPSGLADGELAINQADKLLFYADSVGTQRTFPLLVGTTSGTVAAGNDNRLAFNFCAALAF